MSTQAKSGPRTNPQDIYSTLKSMINKLEIAPGTRVTENQLADYFAVSRTPVRAALHKLESEQLLSIKPKQGCFIRNINLEEISDFYDVRVTLENMVLNEISKQAEKPGLERLIKQWDPDTCQFGTRVSDKLKQAEESFHLQLAELSRNAALMNYITDINQKIRCVRLLGWPDQASVTDTYHEHYRICQLLVAGDLATAQAEMTLHIRKSQENASKVTLNQLFNKRNLVSFE